MVAYPAINFFTHYTASTLINIYMLTNILLSACVVIVSILGMSIGVLFNRKPISGSCGGNKSQCDVCKMS